MATVPDMAPRRARRRVVAGTGLAWSRPLLAAARRIACGRHSRHVRVVHRLRGHPSGLRAAARPGQFTCMAFRRVDVAKGTPGRAPVLDPARPRAARAAATRRPRWPRPTASTPDAGTRQTVAIVDWHDDPTVRPDLNHFDRHYGLPAETSTSFRVVNQNGKAAPLPAADRDASVEIASTSRRCAAVCHKCRIILVEADQASLDRPGARREHRGAPRRHGHQQLLRRAGAAEAPVSRRSIVHAFQHPGVVITASSGDDGYFFWDLATATRSTRRPTPRTPPSFPASLPSAVVGRRHRADAQRRTAPARANRCGTPTAPRCRRQHSTSYALGAAGGGCSTQFTRRAVAEEPARLPGGRLCRQAALGRRGGGRPTRRPASASTTATGSAAGRRSAAPRCRRRVIAGMWALAGGAHGMPNPGRALYQNLPLPQHAPARRESTAATAGAAASTTASCSQQASAELGTNNPNWYYGALVDCSFPRAPGARTPARRTRSATPSPATTGRPASARRTAWPRSTRTLPTVAISASSAARTRITGSRSPGTSSVC